MSEFNGKKIKLKIFGESHGDEIGVIAKGFPPFKIDFDLLYRFLERRKPSGAVYSTKRKESDIPVFYGLKDDAVDGEFTSVIKNENKKSGDYGELYAKPRPSHADYAWYLKDGTLDFSGGGRFSGRLTAPLCVAGGVAKQILASKGVFVEAFVSKAGGVQAKSYKNGAVTREEILKLRDAGGFPSLNKKEEMLNEIALAAKDGDSVGGVIDCVVYGLCGGVGNDGFDGLESEISYALFGVPAVKGVEFGLGFGFSEKRGSEVSDGLTAENGKIRLLSNNNGGINGGITNGENVTLSVAVKPTPSIFKTQKTVNLITNENTEIKIVGRHDACIVPRALAPVESAVAIAVLDKLLSEDKL